MITFFKNFGSDVNLQFVPQHLHSEILKRLRNEDVLEGWIDEQGNLCYNTNMADCEKVFSLSTTALELLKMARKTGSMLKWVECIKKVASPM